MQNIDALRDVSIFGGLRDDILELLLELAAPVEVAAGECFFEEGDRGTSAFVLQAGRVSIHKLHGGRLHHIGDLEPGECFGEVALIDFCARSATVRAEIEARALELTAGDLFAVRERDLEQFTLIYMNMARDLARKLRSANDRLFELGESKQRSPAEHGLLGLL